MDETVTHRATIIGGLREIVDHYDAILCDVWGVVHDGERANDAACAALEQARNRGKPVVLLTNAPRPAAAVMAQIKGFGVPRDCYDAVISSGDVTVALMRNYGSSPFHFIGPVGDFQHLKDGWPEGEALPASVRLAEADYVVCAGLVHDEIECPEDYDDDLATMGRRELTMICANPDLVVYRGNRLAHCAGALADRYQRQGGDAVYAGKPHTPIYEMGRARIEQLCGNTVPLERILAIGDAVRTDVAGAARFGIDVLFVTSGIHRDILHDAGGELDHERYDQFLGGTDARPRAAMPDLVW